MMAGALKDLETTIIKISPLKGLEANDLLDRFAVRVVLLSRRNNPVFLVLDLVKMPFFELVLSPVEGGRENI